MEKEEKKPHSNKLSDTLEKIKALLDEGLKADSGEAIPKLQTAIVIAVFALSAVSVSAEKMPVEGGELNYVSEGEGTPVVFVHGAISDHRVWLPYKDAIVGERRFIAYDQRYYGNTEWPDDAENFSRETHTNDMIAFVEGLDAGPVHLVTWSYSGDISTAAALRRPDLFRSIIHYDPAATQVLGGLPGAKSARAIWASNFGPAVAAMKEGRAEDSALRFLEGVFLMPEGSAADEPEPWPTIWRENGRTVAHFVKMAPNPPISCSDLGGLEVPTLVVQGEKTFTRYSMISEHLARCQPNALLVTMSDVNHDGPYRKPDEFAKMINNFIDLVE